MTLRNQAAKFSTTWSTNTWSYHTSATELSIHPSFKDYAIWSNWEFATMCIRLLVTTDLNTAWGE